MNQRKLGRYGPLASAIGLGCMGMSDLYGPADRRESLATLDAALDAGITLLDTGDYYGAGHNELLLREALARRSRADVILSVKFGALRDASGTWLGFDARPPAVKNSLAHTLQRLGTDYVDIYRPGRLDPQVPIEETVGAIAEMIHAGWVRHIGLSEVGSGTLRRANAVHPIADLQVEYSLMSRGVEDEILRTARRLGVGITAYGTLSRGLMSGHWPAEHPAEPGDIRAFLPRFSDQNLTRNLELVGALDSVARELGATVAQVAIAWVLSRGEDIVPLVGARRRDQLAESLGAVELDLGADELARIEAVVPRGAVAGGRYGEEQMRRLDSEREPTAS